VEELTINQFHPKSTQHRPETLCKITHTQTAIYLFFKINDRYVRCINNEINSEVCKDSCVEFFFQPVISNNSYINFEINAGGTPYVSRVEYSPETQSKITLASKTLMENLSIQSSLPKIIEPEIITPTTWTLQYSISLEFLNKLSRAYPKNIIN
jgi:hypothetical protein